MCEEETLFALSFDTLATTVPACTSGGIVAFKWVVAAALSPIGSQVDTLDSKSRRLIEVPTGAALYRLDGRGSLRISGFPERQLRYVDQADIRSGALDDDTCVFVFSPPSWRGPETAITWIAVSNSTRGYLAEHFVTLKREDAKWRVVGIEIGLQR